MRYIYSEEDGPLASDYYYEARHITNTEIPRVPSHSHNFYEIYVFVGGSILLSVEGHIFDVKKGDIVIIPPYTIHQLLPAEPTKSPYIRMYLYVSVPCLRSFSFNEYDLLSTLHLAEKNRRFHFTIRDMDEYNTITSCMRKIYDNRKEKFREKEMLNRSYILQIMALLNRNIIRELEPQGIVHTMNPTIEKVIRYINENYMDDITLDFLADHFYMNRFTLSKEFKNQTDHTIHNYLKMKRINVAKQELSHGVSPSEVFLLSGFKDYSTFYRAFLKSEGVTPKDFYHSKQ